MAYGIIENGVVVNAVEASAAFAASQGWIKLTGGAGIGWGYDGETFTPPQPDMQALWATLRETRDNLLRDTDWTQIADAPVDQAAWAEYRQALRDLPQTTLDPSAPVWPTPPATL